MPADWSRPVDVDRLADAEETREFDVALAEFPRLADQIAAAARVAVVADLAAADALDADLEAFIAPDGKVALRDLAEEQLLLSLPLVARHEDESQCEAVQHAARTSAAAEQDSGRERARGAISAEEVEPVTQKPFAELGELLKRKR